MKRELDQFYQSLGALELRSKGISEKRELIETRVEKFISDINAIKLDSSVKNKNKDLAKHFQSTLDNSKKKIEQWKEFFEKSAKEEKFREGLENKFIIFIYGKVKAGKSTLGNFVAEHCLETQKPKFKIYEKAGEKDINKFEEGENENAKPKQEQFKTGITETTSEIQLFELDAMAWVDTPGLSSMTEKNGKLAKEYIQAADYIIFPTDSNAPLPLDEVKQIKDLINYGKKVHIIITKSDVREKDEVNGEIITIYKNKDSKTRQGQEEDVKQRIKKEGLIEKIEEEVLSLSVFMAKKGLENNDKDAFNDSNITQFYQSLSKVVNEKAQSLKSQAPYNTLIGFLKEIEKGTQNNKGLEAIKKDFDELYGELGDLKNEIEDIEGQLESKIHTRIIEISDELDQKKINKLANETKNFIDDKFTEKIKKIERAIENRLPNVDIRLENKYESIKVKRWWNNLLSWTGLVDEYYEIKHIKKGDNRAEIRANLKKTFTKLFKEYILKLKKQIQRDFFDEYEVIFYNINECIKGLQKDIKKFKKDLESDLNNSQTKQTEKMKENFKEVGIYQAFKQQIKELEDGISKFLSQSRIKEFYRDLDTKLNDFNPKFMLYGGYNVGKSTLANALLAKEVAKVADKAQTSQIVEYKYKNYTFYDTPGLNADEKHTSKTKEKYKEIDIIVFVMSDGGDVEFAENYERIKEIITDKKPMIIAFNRKQDSSEEDLQLQLQKVYKNLKEAGIDEQIRVIAINAKSALKAKLENKENLLKDSNIKALELAIDDILKDTSKASFSVAFTMMGLFEIVESFMNDIFSNIDNDKVKNIGAKKFQELVRSYENLQTAIEKIKAEYPDAQREYLRKKHSLYLPGLSGMFEIFQRGLK